MAARKASACAGESATVTVLAWTLRVQRQAPGWPSPTLPSLSQSKVPSSARQASKRARRLAGGGADFLRFFGRKGWAFIGSIYTYSECVYPLLFLKLSAPSSLSA